MLRTLRSLLICVILLVSSMGSSPVLTQDVQEASTPDAPSDMARISLFPKEGDDGERFEITAEPGQTVETVAIIGNFGAEPIKLKKYKANVLPVVNGGLGLADPAEEPVGSTAWMSWEDEEFTLGSAEVIERTIQVTVPEGTPPGQYVNAVIIETLDPVNSGSTGGLFEQFLRKIVSVYINVPGEVVSDFELEPPEPFTTRGRAALNIPIVNTGNTRVDLVGSVQVTSADGSVYFDSQLVLGPVYMGQRSLIQFPLAESALPGEYFVTYELSDSTSGVVRSADSVAFTVPEFERVAEADQFSFTNVVVEPNADPVVFANVSVDVSSLQASQRSTRLTLSVFHNGDHVEDFVLADNLSLDAGNAVTVSQRYLPMESWESGTYTFSLKLESTADGEGSLLFEQQDVATLEVP